MSLVYTSALCISVRPRLVSLPPQWSRNSDPSGRVKLHSYFLVQDCSWYSMIFCYSISWVRSYWGSGMAQSHQRAQIFWWEPPHKTDSHWYFPSNRLACLSVVHWRDCWYRTWPIIRMQTLPCWCCCWSPWRLLGLLRACATNLMKTAVPMHHGPRCIDFFHPYDLFYPIPSYRSCVCAHLCFQSFRFAWAHIWWPTSMSRWSGHWLLPVWGFHSLSSLGWLGVSRGA